MAGLKLILYKYTGFKTALDILQTKKFRYTQPIAFNDPFEVSPVSENDIGIEFLNDNIDFILNSPVLREIVFKTAVEDLFNELPEDEKHVSTFKEFKENLIKDIDEYLKQQGLSLNEILVNKLKKISPQYTKYFFGVFPLTVGQSTGVFCLSDVSNNMLMWSHYANSHLGIVLEIETSNPFFSNLKNINYTLKRPSIDVNLKYKNDDDKIKFAKNIFYTKSEDWSYEHEYRDLKSLEDGENINQTDGFGFPIILFQFPTDIIKSVIFGSRINLTSKKQFIDATKLLGYKVEFKEAILDKELFKINIENYNSERKIIE